MATDTAPAPTRRDPTKNVWQWPAFLLGAAVFAAAWHGAIPLVSPDPSAGFGHDLAALRGLAESANPDAAALTALIQKLAADAEQYPALAAQAHFVLGSAYARRAEITAAREPAQEDWALAVQHFDKVAAEKLPDPAGDGPRLSFRSAKAWTAVGLGPDTTPAQVGTLIQVLTHVPPNELPGEANRLLPELLLRATPPELGQAKETLARYLSEAGLSTPTASLTRAKFRLAEMQLTTGEADTARKLLAQIGPDAPADVFAPARAHLARLLMKDSAWDAAAKEWELVRGSSVLPPGLKTQAAYQLGFCRQMVKQPDAAAKLFEEAARADGPEAFAATVRAADLALRGTDPAARATAAARLVAATKDVTAAGYTNALVSLDEVRATFEQAVQTLQADGAYEQAVAASEAYRRVAVAGREREKRAEILTAWAESLRKQGGDYKPKFAAAAEEVLAQARATDAPPAAQLDLFRRAAVLFGQADNPVAMHDALAALVKVPNAPEEAVGGVWLEYANVLLDHHQPDEALKAFQQAMLTAGPAATAARYKLARLLLDAQDPRKLPLGADLLRQVATAEQGTAPDHDFREKALVELGQDALKAGRFPEAESLFRKQIGLHPKGPEAEMGQFLLGVCLLQQAAHVPGADDRPDAPKMRKEALDLFKSLVTAVDVRRQPAAVLSERDAWLRTQSALRVLQAYQQLDQPTEVITFAAGVREECRGKVEELIALSMMYHAWKQQNHPENAKRVFDEMRIVFDAMPDAAFRAGGGEYSKEYWEKVWFAPPPSEPAPTGSAPPAPAPASPAPLIPVGGTAAPADPSTPGLPAMPAPVAPTEPAPGRFP